MIEGRKLIYGVIAFLVMVAVFAAALFFLNPREEIQESGKVALRVSEGLNIEYPNGRENGERVIFERYRLFDDAGEYKLLGSEGNINISKENAEVFLTHPDGTQEDVTSDLWFFPMRIFPPQPKGTYTLTFNLKTGETYKQTIEITKSEEVQLVLTNQKRTQEKPEVKFGTPLTPEQSFLLSDFGVWDRESRDLSAFSLENLDLTKATSVYYIDPHDTVKSMSTPGFEVDKYFWLDLFKMSEIQIGEHIFLAKIDNVWHYAIANYPEDFK